MTLTKLESQVIDMISDGDEFENFPTECFEDIVDYTNIKPKALRGVISSLIKKEYLSEGEYPNGMVAYHLIKDAPEADLDESLMNTRNIVRMEDKNGVGVFMSRLTDDADIYTPISDRHDAFPSPRRDDGIGDLFLSGVHYCAYKSVEEFRNWIMPHEVKVLMELGFKVLLLTVTDCIEGQFQAIYEKANVLECKDISDLF